MKPVSVDHALCDRCGLCVELCGRDGLRLEDDRIVLGGVRCLECGHCVAICPRGALATEFGTPPEFDPATLPDADALTRLMRARRSHRHYLPREIEREKIERLLDLARYSPSGKNAQPFEFVIVHTPEGRRKITEACYEAMRKGQRRLHNALWRFVVGLLFDARVRDPGVRRSLDRALRRREAGMDPLFFAAPLIVFVHGAAGGATPKDDCVYALMHMVLLAETLGLGSCINGNSEVLIRHFPEVKRLLGVPADHRVYAVATFGYPRLRFRRFVHRRALRARWI